MDAAGSSDDAAGDNFEEVLGFRTSKETAPFPLVLKGIAGFNLTSIGVDTENPRSLSSSTIKAQRYVVHMPFRESVSSIPTSIPHSISPHFSSHIRQRICQTGARSLNSPQLKQLKMHTKNDTIYNSKLNDKSMHHVSRRSEGGDEQSYAVVEGRKVPFDPVQLRKIKEHPCFSREACHIFGRIHLPVAPKCNIQCNYCIRKFDCVNESRPGVTSKVLTPEEAIERVREVMKRLHYIKVVAVAGPGEPLFNSETFETFRLLKEEFPFLLRCVSTNGLLLPEKIDELHSLGISTITVTINAIDPEIGKNIYSFINYHDRRYSGEEGARILIENQLKGVEEAVKRKILVKVNTVLIPTVNDMHVVEIAKRISALGAYIHNIIPLIPQFKFADIPPPSPEQKRKVQEECAKYIKQMMHCRRCRADAIGKLGKDVKIP